jgi:uncharacterized protein YecE (DUF72 family)
VIPRGGEVENTTSKRSFWIGTAGWSLPREERLKLPEGPSHLARYALALPAVEVNSSFYRNHKPETYQRWAREVPPGFRFSVKVPRAITHFARLKEPKDLLREFIEGPLLLGGKLGPLLLQLPPSLAFDARVAGGFLEDLRALHSGPAACEPRHPSWFTAEVEGLLDGFRVALVAADPRPGERAFGPGGWKRLAYFRLHGSPQMYYSQYPAEFLGELAAKLRDIPRNSSAWCIFDNTATGAALSNALDLLGLLQKDVSP